MNDHQQTGKDYSGNDESPIEEIIEEAKRNRERDEEEQPSKSLSQQLKELGLDRKIELGVAVVGLIIAIVLAIIAGFQLGAMREQTTKMQGQLDEMQKGSGDTKLLAEASKRQATNTSEQVGQLKALVEQTHNLATATQESINNAKETSHRELRSYVVIGSNDIPKLEEGKRPFVTSVVENIGKTPIYDGGWISGINVFTYPLTEDITNDSCTNVLKSPGAPKWLIGRSSKIEKWRVLPFQASEVKAIKEGRAAVYFHGRICYRDIFREVHYTDFCMRWRWENGHLGEGLACPQGNGGN
ncbi:MAG: hypothetical protein CAF41_003095 [Nitrospira sp. CG24A]|nr:MAG: hypothetical protein CAF41_003095 [Nitrospira sp. CG24A]